MAADLVAGLGIFKSLYDSVKALKDMNDATVRNGAVIELQKEILSAQAAQSALIDRIRELEQEVRGFEDWESEKRRYELKDLGFGALAYMLKSAMRVGEPPHWVCPNCFSKKHVSIIQYTMIEGLGHRNICWPCKLQIHPAPDAYEPGTSGPRWLD